MFMDSKNQFRHHFAAFEKEIVIYFYLPKTQHMNTKVEKNLKGSFDSIPTPSPSVKIQIMAGKFT